MKSDLIVASEHDIYSELGSFCGVEPFSVKHFFSQCPFKALVVSIFPWRARMDLHWYDPNLLKPSRCVEMNSGS